jgi:hypothetical protein
VYEPFSAPMANSINSQVGNNDQSDFHIIDHSSTDELRRCLSLFRNVQVPSSFMQTNFKEPKLNPLLDSEASARNISNGKHGLIHHQLDCPIASDTELEELYANQLQGLVGISMNYS